MRTNVDSWRFCKEFIDGIQFGAASRWLTEPLSSFIAKAVPIRCRNTVAIRSRIPNVLQCEFKPGENQKELDNQFRWNIESIE